MTSTREYHWAKVDDLLSDRSGRVIFNPSRSFLIDEAVERGAAMALPQGTLATWTPQDSTGRSPKDTYIVQRPESEGKIDWSAPNSIPMAPETFDMIFEDLIVAMHRKYRLYTLDRVVGADPTYCLPVRTVVSNPLAGVFTDNMFRPVPSGVAEKSCFAASPFLLLGVSFDKLDRERYQGRLRELADGRTSDMAVVTDFDRGIGIVFGSCYMGSMKKLIFTAMNYYLPDQGILPLHCSANEGATGDVALFLGLSGTGKTTLSADPERALIGDDEHGWSENGIANFEAGCYAKLINLDPDKEPEIYHATFRSDHYLNHGAIAENLMVYPNGTFDLDDDRHTPNTRASYPLTAISNAKPEAKAGHPKAIVFLTADAFGVLPPVAKLTPEQAMFWFMMGYTSKLAGTETDVVEPKAAFSRFFGGPFMPRNPSDYTELLREKLDRYQARVFLVNTGWTGGSYGTGKRIAIPDTRRIVEAAITGELDDVTCRHDAVFKLYVPMQCAGVSDELLDPRRTWDDSEAFLRAAASLAKKFQDHFEQAFAGKVSADIAAQCPDAAYAES